MTEIPKEYGVYLVEPVHQYRRVDAKAVRLELRYQGAPTGSVIAFVIGKERAVGRMAGALDDQEFWAGVALATAYWVENNMQEMKLTRVYELQLVWKQIQPVWEKVKEPKLGASIPYAPRDLIHEF